MRTMSEIRRDESIMHLRLERDFLRWLNREPVSMRTKSIFALVEYGLDESLPDVIPFPGYPTELAACEAVYMRAPEHLRGRMLTLLQQYRTKVEARWGVNEMIEARYVAKQYTGGRS